jgi:hypothetical protein
MTTNSSLTQGFPNVQIPFVDEEWRVTKAWYQFLYALWNRTGQGTGLDHITEVDTGAGLTGGPIDPSNPIGTISLAPIGVNNVMANLTAGSAAAAGNTVTSVLDVIGATQGDIMYRNATTWVALTPGTSGNVLTTQGAGANPKWDAAGSAGTGRLLGIQVFASHGTSTYTPAGGTTQVQVLTIGAGGGGGSTFHTSGSEISIANGGGAGAACMAFYTTGFSGATVTVGTGGAGGTSLGNGAAGGNSSFVGSGSTSQTTNGGAGGGAGINSAPPGYSGSAYGSGGAGPGASSGQIFFAPGAAGEYGMYLTTANAKPTFGGASILGGGGLNPGLTSGAAGSNATSPGAGGGGAASTTSSGTSFAGGAGADGLVVVWEYS